MRLDRLRLILVCFILVTGVVLFRLFYWQIIKAKDLAALGDTQHSSKLEIPSNRGRIITADGFTLVDNEPAYLAYASLPDVPEPKETHAKLIAPIVRPDLEASASSQELNTLTALTEATIAARLTSPNKVWVPLARKLTEEKKHALEALGIPGIGFETEPVRFYPEASMAASLLGFVGSNESGNPTGYFGLEGYYDLELKGKPGIIRQEKDASGRTILIGDFGGFEQKDGRSLKLYLDRSVQRIVETELQEGIQRYGAKSGEVIIMDPKTGGVVALAALPTYEAARYARSDPTLFRNSAVADSYEPGSTFKILVMAAAIDSGVVTPETRCTECDGPVEIGEYTIRTWNQEYHPNITATEIIQYSDNVGMVFVGNKIGKETLYDYLQKFGLGEKTGIDLEEETAPGLLPIEKWGDVHLATISFGQGIALTGIQIVQAVGAIANGGVLMQPRVVESIIGETTVKLLPHAVRRVVSPEAAAEVTRMMVNAVDQGEAQWIKIKGYTIAGKTGTAQIPLAGYYDEEKTIASFVGFAPAYNPKFVMLVKLREPTTSPWAAETAAPLWTRIAKELFLYYGIPPDR